MCRSARGHRTRSARSRAPSRWRPLRERDSGANVTERDICQRYGDITSSSLRGAKRRSNLVPDRRLDCFASLAMTGWAGRRGEDRGGNSQWRRGETGIISSEREGRRLTVNARLPFISGKEFSLPAALAVWLVVYYAWTGRSWQRYKGAPPPMVRSTPFAAIQTAPNTGSQRRGWRKPAMTTQMVRSPRLSPIADAGPKT